MAMSRWWATSLKFYHAAFDRNFQQHQCAGGHDRQLPAQYSEFARICVFGGDRNSASATPIAPLSGGNFTFNFGTANGQSYTVQQNTNLAKANWTFYTNITGNGSIYQFATPVTNFPRRFFRVGSP